MTADPHAYASFRRHLLGVMGVACLITGIYFYVRPPTIASVEFVQGSCVKAGLVLIATWLAFPQLDRLPGWVLAVVVGFLLVVATRPRIALFFLRYAFILSPIFIVIWLLRPKVRRGPTR